MRRSGRGVVVLGIAALAVAAGPGPAAAGPADRNQDPPGKRIFEGKGACFACHGMAGKGTPVAPDLTDGAWVNFEKRPTQEQVRNLVKQGVPKPVAHPAPMPPMGGASLDDDEVAAVAAYVLALSAGDG